MSIVEDAARWRALVIALAARDVYVDEPDQVCDLTDRFARHIRRIGEDQRCAEIHRTVIALDVWNGGHAR